VATGGRIFGAVLQRFGAIWGVFSRAGNGSGSGRMKEVETPVEISLFGTFCGLFLEPGSEPSGRRARGRFSGDQWPPKS
jgi:hypothetical protein